MKVKLANCLLCNNGNKEVEDHTNRILRPLQNAHHTKAGNESYQKQFFEELDEFLLHMPGNRTVPFSDDQNLLDMIQLQYSGWKERGRITSVPIVRAPKVFLHHSQLQQHLKEKLKSAVRGDDAEMKLYCRFVDESFAEEPGMMVFPNIDGSHIFDTQVAKVEIDMVLVHSKKGVFVFNVKNQIGKGTSVQDMRDDIAKHTLFLRMLIQYNNPTASKERISIHTVVCDFAKNKSKFRILETETENTNGKILVFNKNELDTDAFPTVWKQKLIHAGIQDITWHFSIDRLLARLVALSSIEGASALMHDQVRTGLMQSTTNVDNLIAQTSSSSSVGEHDGNGLKETIIEHSLIEHKKGKKRFILWSKEQMKVIATVYQQLVNFSGKGMRLLVTGSKGSGKTMLLIAVAKMVATMKNLQDGETSSRILVCEGTKKSTGLLMMFRKTFSSTSIAVSDPSGGDSLLTEQLKSTEILLCDETTPGLYGYFLERMKPEQHIIFFASNRKAHLEQNFEILHLSSNLRSTCQIANFANSYIERGPRNVFLASPNSKLQGEPVEVRFVKSDVKNQWTSDLFESKCIDVIEETVQKFIGLDYIVVVQFLNCDTLRRIKENLKSRQYICYNGIAYLENCGWYQTTAALSDDVYPAVVFCEPDEGCEFATVLILIDGEIFDTFFFPFYGSPILTAATRATLKVIFVVKEFDIPNNEFVKNALTNTQKQQMKSVIKNMSDHFTRESSVLFVGKRPPVEKTEQKFYCKVEGLSLYETQGSRILYIDDIYERTDLEKVRSMGIDHFFIATKSVTCPWQYFFYMASTICVRSFCLQHSNSLTYKALVYNSSLRKFRVVFHLAFLKHQSGISGVSFPETWLDFEGSTMPLTEELSWHKWKAKAEELLKINEIAPAVFMFECSIKSLKQQLAAKKFAEKCEAIEARKPELVNLLRTISKVCIDYADEITRGSKFDFFLKALHYEDSLLKAFRNATNALALRIEFEKGISLMEDVIVKLRKYSHNESFKLLLSQLYSEEQQGLKVDRFRPQCASASVSAEIGFQLRKLGSLISDYYKSNFSESKVELTKLKQNVSAQARKASESNLQYINETIGEISTAMSQEHIFEQSFNKIMNIFDYSVQPTMVAIHWDPSKPKEIGLKTKANQTLDSALDKLDEVIALLKEQTELK